MIYAQKMKNGFFGNHYAKWKGRHLVYEFFDTSQGGYHPQMETAVSTCIEQKQYKIMGGDKIVLFKYFGLKIWYKGDVMV